VIDCNNARWKPETNTYYISSVYCTTATGCKPSCS